MRQSTTLIVNLAATYGRMALTIALGLVGIRLLLSVLGEVDFGLLSALVATGSILNLLQSSLVASCRRFLGVSIGRGDRAATSVVFTNSLAVFAAAGLVLAAVGLSLTPLVMNGLTIPEDRADAARWVYWLGMANLALNVLSTPYLAMMNAHQSIVSLSVLEVVHRVGLFAGIVALPWVPGDPLITYILLDVSVGLLTLRLGSIAYCVLRYDDCRLRPSRITWSEARGILGFAGWSFFERMNMTMREHGAVVALNVIFGPAVNAAFDIARRLSNYMAAVPVALSNVVAPAVNVAEGQSHRQNMLRLSAVTNRYAFFSVFLLWLPIALDCEVLLNLWLGRSLPYAAEFCVLVLSARLIGTLTWGENMVIAAKNRLRFPVLATSIPQVMVFIVVLLLMDRGVVGPLALPATQLMLVPVLGVGVRAWYAGRLAGRPWTTYLSQSLVRAMLAVTPSVALALMFRLTMDESAWRLLAITAANTVVMAAAFWLIGTERWEREQLVRFVRRAAERLRRSGPPTAPGDGA